MATRPSADAVPYDESHRSSDSTPILYSGDPIESGGDDGGRTGKNFVGPRPAPMMFMSRGVRAYLVAAPADERASLDELIDRPEVKEAARAASKNDAQPDLFVFFNKPRTEVKLLLRTDGGYTVVHRKLIQGTFDLSRNVVAGGRIAVDDLAELLSGRRRAGFTAAGHETTASWH